MLRSVALTLAAVLIARVHEPRMTTAAPGDQDIHQLMTSARDRSRCPLPISTSISPPSTVSVVDAGGAPSAPGEHAASASIEPTAARLRDGLPQLIPHS